MRDGAHVMSRSGFGLRPRRSLRGASRDAEPEVRAQKRAQISTSLMWHVGSFVIVNSLFWILDLITGENLQWA